MCVDFWLVRVLRWMEETSLLVSRPLPVLGLEGVPPPPVSHRAVSERWDPCHMYIVR